MIAYTAQSLCTPTSTIKDSVVVVEDGVITALGTREATQLPSNIKLTNFGDCTIAPGFIDIHIHGSAGFDVMQVDQSRRSGFERFLAQHGVTAYCPTTVAAPLDETLAALERLADGIEGVQANGGGGARPIGVHLEGPFLSHARRGVHKAEDLIVPNLRTFEQLWQAARGHVRVLTIAPELNGAAEVIAEAARRGVTVSLGHSDADLESARRGVAAGARHATHTFNAMRPLGHRDPGILAEVLTNDSLTADVIADGFHVAPSVIDLLIKAKTPEKVVLITDAMSAAGMPDGHYQLGLIDVVLKAGMCTVNGTLAGSALTLDRAMRNVMNFGKLELKQAVQAATANPARVVRAKGKGMLQPGSDADFVALTADGEVRATVINGAVVQ
jgi:N-acetylglucosamine-6-phosphate deacetylase